MLHGFAAATLLLSFALLRRPQPAVYAAQGWLVAGAAAWQGWLQNEPALIVIAIIGGLVRGLAVPRLLRRIPVPPISRGGPLLSGLAVVVLAATLSRPLPGREDLAAALSVVGIGLLIMTVRQEAAALGLLSLEAGAALLAATAGLTPASLAPLSLGGLALAIAVAGAVAVARQPA